MLMAGVMCVCIVQCWYSEYNDMILHYNAIAMQLVQWNVLNKYKYNVSILQYIIIIILLYYFYYY